MGTKTKAEILAKLDEALQTPETLYARPFVNYRGVTRDGKEKITEVVAAALLETENLRALAAIEPLRRQGGYRVAAHTGRATTGRGAGASNRQEEHIALQMYGREYGPIGRVVDYQVPLKNRQSDRGLGKIDLLAHKGDALYLLELKRPDSRETLLRSALEVYTYWQTVDKPKLLADYAETGAARVCKGALVFEGGPIAGEWANAEHTRALMATLEIEFFMI